MLVIHSAVGTGVQLYSSISENGAVSRYTMVVHASKTVAELMNIQEASGTNSSYRQVVRTYDH